MCVCVNVRTHQPQMAAVLRSHRPPRGAACVRAVPLVLVRGRVHEVIKHWCWPRGCEGTNHIPLLPPHHPPPLLLWLSPSTPPVVIRVRPTSRWVSLPAERSCSLDQAFSNTHTHSRIETGIKRIHCMSSCSRNVHVHMVQKVQDVPRIGE